MDYTDFKDVRKIIASPTHVVDGKIVATLPNVEVKPKKTRYITVVNDETGEIEYLCQVSSNKKIGGSWSAVFHQSLKWLSKQGLTGEEWNVFAQMAGSMDFENYVRINQTKLSQELNIDQANVSKAIKKLRELDVLAEGPRAGLNKTYMINPNMSIRGKQKQQKVIDYNDIKDIRSARTSRRKQKPGADAPKPEE